MSGETGAAARANGTGPLATAAARVTPYLSRVEMKARREATRLAGLSFSQLPAGQAVRMVYNVLLRREPDPTGFSDLTTAMATGQLSHDDVMDRVRCSSEYRTQVPVGVNNLHSSLHASRCEFIISLPPARRIIDLGGGHTIDPRGALVVLGYPYDFDELVVVDLPPDDRHPLYHSERFGAGDTEHGKVRYEYRSMADLSFAADNSVDLIYSGQSIEHVTPADGDIVLGEALRVLKPGGYLAIDTPNGKVCRLQQDAFIDPDHKVEYTLDELRAKVTAAGIEVVAERGLNWGGPAVGRGEFDPETLAANYGTYFDAESCYLLALLCRKPSAR
ncbi:MAG TPA: methyltransferase domain-containing protein [Acidimicrobiales bacterium]|nr:methyltransferase domain-containing protein [Acidimicrobiales bacterium]